MQRPLRNAAISRLGRPPLGVKFKNAPIELKIGTGMFSTTPDTMAVSVLRENDVVTSRYHAYFTHMLREKS